jgi:hypothetical protein
VPLDQFPGVLKRILGIRQIVEQFT